MKNIFIKLFFILLFTTIIVILAGYFFNTNSSIEYYNRNEKLDLNLKQFYKVVNNEYEKIKQKNKEDNLNLEYLLVFKWKKDDSFELAHKQKGDKHSINIDKSIASKIFSESILKWIGKSENFKSFLIVHNHPPTSDETSYSALLPSDVDKESFKTFNQWTSTIDSFIFKNDYENEGIFSTAQNIGYQTFIGYLKSLIESNFIVYRLKSIIPSILVTLFFVLIFYLIKNRNKISKNNNPPKNNNSINNQKELDEWSKKYDEYLKKQE